MSSISSGDILRENVRKRTILGQQAEQIMRTGGLVSDSIMVKLIVGELSRRGWVESRSNLTAGVTMTGALSIIGHEARATKLAASSCPTSSFLLDGFPRTPGQAKSLDEEVDMNLVINLDVPRDAILERIANRWVHEPSGRIYNTTWNPPRVPGLDDETGEPLTRRPDDNPETFAKRLKQYDDATMPLLEHYDKAGILWTVRGETSDVITPQLDAEIMKRFG